MKCLIVLTDTRKYGGMLACARGIGGEVVTMVVGDEPLAAEIASAGSGRTLFVRVDPEVPVESFASSVAQIALREAPDVVFGNDAAPTRVLLGAISGVLDAAIVGAVVNLSGADGVVSVEHLVAGDRAVECVEVTGVLTCIYAGEDADIERFDSASFEEVPASAKPARVVSTVDAVSSGLDCAQRIVGIGMGIQSKDDLALVDELAGALDAQTACTLPLCDSVHWFDESRVLGSSHRSAAPQLYVAIGISGSPNHTSGVRDAKTVVAINSDPEAEIFRNCKYGIVGDLYQIVPALTEQLANATKR